MYIVIDLISNKILFSATTRVKAINWYYANLPAGDIAIIEERHADNKTEAYNTALNIFGRYCVRRIAYIKALSAGDRRVYCSTDDFRRMIIDTGCTLLITTNGRETCRIYYRVSLFNPYGEEAYIYETPGKRRAFTAEIPGQNIRRDYRTFETAYDYLYNRDFRRD